MSTPRTPTDQEELGVKRRFARVYYFAMAPRLVWGTPSDVRLSRTIVQDQHRNWRPFR